MAPISSKRKVCRTVFTKLYNDLLPMLDAGRVDVTEITAKFRVFEGRYHELVSLNQQVVDELCDRTDGDEFDRVMLAEADTCDEYSIKYHTIKLKVEALTQPPPSEISNVGSVGNCNGAKIKLPKLEFRQFNGEISQWIGFWSQFECVHLDKSFTDEAKFQYLIQATKPGSRARTLVESFPPSAANYEKAITQLKTRFGRDELLIEYYVRELLSLVLQHATSKSSLTLAQLTDHLETQLMALESLGVTSEKYACMLYPLVESALPETVLREWERGRREVRSGSGIDDTTFTNASAQMEKLRAFLKREVESEERVSLARNTFKTSKDPVIPKPTAKKLVHAPRIPTAADLVSLEASDSKSIKCAFCNSLEHDTEFCFKSREMSLDEKYKLLRSKKRCFRCLTAFHGSRACKKKMNCLICAKDHPSAMCPTKKSVLEPNPSGTPGKGIEHNYSNVNCAPVLMQTLKVKIRGENAMTARLMIDTGSQHSYITRQLASKMNLEPVRVENLVHALFGGGTTKVVRHQCYRIRLQNLASDFACSFEALDSEDICHAVPAVPRGPWLSELKKLRIPVTDTDEGAIDILVGADVAGRLFTGRRHVLSCGLVALETSLGWTIMGRIREESSNAMLNIATMCALDLSPSEIWRLDVIGICDPADVSTEVEARTAARAHFEKTVKVLDDGRYEVSLPWLIGHKPLPRGFNVAMNRLKATVRKLQSAGLYDAYSAVFDEWLREDFIEEVPCADWDRGHYLPHRPVVKEGSTTRIRPVFDASAHEVGQPNLNQCLEKGENLIELIPSILLRFRLNQLGVVSDIRKAFLQIAVCEADRDYLRFLWHDESGKLRIFRHRRVVFGVTSSPYLLGAVIGYHLARCEKKVQEGNASYSQLAIEKLRNGLYVDNCVTSIDGLENVETFVVQAKRIFWEACFDLRGWEWTDPSLISSIDTPVLGVLWDRKLDVLKLNPPRFENFDEHHITRRIVQSASQKVFDPIGAFSPACLIPRLIIQQSWLDGGTWDSPLEEENRKAFLKWMREVTALNELELPRWIKFSVRPSKVSLHTFADASQKAFAAVAFLRVEAGDDVFITLVAAKARVSPVKRVTIPRLELLAATIAARLAGSILKELGDVECFYWSDSTTALSWIRREEPWGVFVFNRVQEIRKLTNVKDWRHVPGHQNPADIVSRGCSPMTLMESKWWEGPDWLHQSPSQWPSSEGLTNEEEILEEKRKTVVAAVTCPITLSSACFNRFSQYCRILNVTGWVIRFLLNKYSKRVRTEGKLKVFEVARAERLILRLVQEESFGGPKDEALKKLKPHVDKHGLIRLRTKIWARRDSEDFRSPIILPSNHEIVKKLIMETHKRNGHVVGQNLLNLLRERYWVLKGRQTVKRVVRECAVCQRFHAKCLEVETPPLPENRVRDANIFEICGTDLAGPLYLANGDKVWICLFTCAIYRAVHFEIVSSQSTEGFMLAFRRFVALRGRPSVIYSDNGRNFRGTSNALQNIDWEQVAAEGAIERIDWRFNPPRAAWWGGFWERLVGVLKVLLRKLLGRASLNYEELCTLVYECATYVNRRPITYLSDDPNDPVPITPQMFLQEITTNAVPDLDAVDCNTMKRKLLRIVKLRQELRNRFRSEYLGQLHLPVGGFKEKRSPLVGEVVLIGSNSEKRIDWPLAVVEELITGIDGKCRAVKLRTANGHLSRSIQHVFPLEIFPDGAVQSEKSTVQPLPKCRGGEDFCHDGKTNKNSGQASSSEDPSGVPTIDEEFSTEIKKCDGSQGAQKQREKNVTERCLLKFCETRCGRKVKLPVRFVD